MSSHDVLGVSQNATKEEIKAAYRKRVMECHPDRNPGDADAVRRFCEVQDAYESITNPSYRPPRSPQASYQAPRPRSDHDWIRDAPPPTHDIWGNPVNGHIDPPRRKPKPRPAPVKIKIEPEVDLWKSMETKASRISKGYWTEYERLKKVMVHEDPDKFWEAIDDWARKNK